MRAQRPSVQHALALLPLSLLALAASACGARGPIDFEVVDVTVSPDASTNSTTGSSPGQTDASTISTPPSQGADASGSSPETRETPVSRASPPASQA